MKRKKKNEEREKCFALQSAQKRLSKEMDEDGTIQFLMQYELYEQVQDSETSVYTVMNDDNQNVYPRHIPTVTFIQVKVPQMPHEKKTVWKKIVEWIKELVAVILRVL